MRQRGEPETGAAEHERHGGTGGGDGELVVRGAWNLRHLGRAAEERQLDPGDVNAELARDERVTELVDQHRRERETHQQDAGDPAERDEHQPEQQQEADIDLDREPERGSQSP